MTSARALIERLIRAGVSLRIDGEDLVHRGPRRSLTSDVLAEIGSHKAEIIAELRRGEIKSSVAAHLVFADAVREGFDEVGAARLRHAEAESLHREILGEVVRLPAARHANTRRLVAETRKFLESPWWEEAVASGWTLKELFGVDSGAPLDEISCWGLVVGLAWAPQASDSIALIDGHRAVIRFRSRATPKEMHRVHKRLPATDGVVLWWECAALRGDLD